MVRTRAAVADNVTPERMSLEAEAETDEEHVSQLEFSELARHAPILVPTIRERVCKFIEMLDNDIKICMARELQTDTPFQQVVEIVRKIEGVLDKEMESKKAKRSRRSGGLSGFYSSARTHYSEGSSSRPAQSAHQTTRSAPVSSCDAPPARDSYNSYSSYPAQTQYEQQQPQGGCYECGDTRHIMRDCPSSAIMGSNGRVKPIKPSRSSRPFGLLRLPFLA
ncbi:uncharacterized protein [Nicotiana tomentosiformis]|uniref:uncharacterized protein n=1 Tax=Nicotiana tomentosiformis TaxID=4098 RepID=UPI00388CDDB4